MLDPPLDIDRTPVPPHDPPVPAQGDALDHGLGLGGALLAEVPDRGQRREGPLWQCQFEAADGLVGDRLESRRGDALGADVGGADEVDRDAIALQYED